MPRYRVTTTLPDGSEVEWCDEAVDLDAAFQASLALIPAKWAGYTLRWRHERVPTEAAQEVPA